MRAGSGSVGRKTDPSVVMPRAVARLNSDGGSPSGSSDCCGAVRGSHRAAQRVGLVLLDDVRVARARPGSAGP